MASPLRRRLRRAAADPRLGPNVRRATNLSIAQRDAAVAERPDFPALRARAAAVRGHALDHLDRYLAEFAANVAARGGTIHFAPDARAAARIVAEIARRKGATRILKSKSMASEEVDLNAVLARRGLEPLETDLGEYIVQLAGEPPSHITAPALHRSAEEIRDLLEAHGVLAGRGEAPAERRELARWLSLAARAHLRSRLLDADLGITGANFLVAETGTVVLVENEGNIRFTTTTPPVQVVLAGIDKIVARFSDLGTLLPLLTRSATGQRMSAYVSFITGPLRELHVVLLDNGRTRALADPHDREVLRCIRCGACLNICPVYRSAGGHAYGSPYPGPVGALLTPLLRGRTEDFDLPHASSLCGACTDVCPVGIDLAAHLLRLRGREAAARRRPLAERLAFRLFRFLMAGPRRYAFAAAMLGRFAGPAERLGLLAAWARHRAVPEPAERTFRQMWREDGPPSP